MHDVIRTDTGRRLELRARVASGVFFLVALLGLLLPWAVGSGTGLDLLLDIRWSDMVRHPDWPGLVSVVVLALLPLAGLALSIRGTRRMAVGRVILAAVGAVPFVIEFGLVLAFTGRPPDLIGGWVTFAAHVGAVVANCIAHRAWRRDRGETGVERPDPRWQRLASATSGVFFTAALVGLLLPWDRVGRVENQTGLEWVFSMGSGSSGPVLLFVATVAAAALTLVRKRWSAVVRAAVAALVLTPFLFHLSLSLWLGGDLPETGAFVTFWALLGAVVASVFAALAGRRPDTSPFVLRMGGAPAELRRRGRKPRMRRRSLTRR